MKLAIVGRILLTVVCVMIVVVALVSCADKPVVYKEVKVPVKCEISKRDRPAKSDSTVHYLRDILIYTEGLERDLSFCRGQKTSQ